MRGIWQAEADSLDQRCEVVTRELARCSSEGVVATRSAPPTHGTLLRSTRLLKDDHSATSAQRGVGPEGEVNGALHRWLAALSAANAGLAKDAPPPERPTCNILNRSAVAADRQLSQTGQRSRWRWRAGRRTGVVAERFDAPICF